MQNQKNLERMRLEVNKRMEGLMLEIVKLLDDMNSRNKRLGNARAKAGKLNASR